MMMMMMMMLIVGPFGTTCSDMIQIMYEILLITLKMMSQRVTNGPTDWRTPGIARVAIRN